MFQCAVFCYPVFWHALFVIRVSMNALAWCSQLFEAVVGFAPFLIVVTVNARVSDGVSVVQLTGVLSSYLLSR